MSKKHIGVRISGPPPLKNSQRQRDNHIDQANYNKMKTMYLWLLGMFNWNEKYSEPTYILFNFLRLHLDKDVYLTDQWGIPLKGREEEYYHKTYWDKLLNENEK
jgi:hypothetical protein